MPPVLSEGFASEDALTKYQGQIDMGLEDFFADILGSNEIKIASIPYRFVIFKSTERFKNIISHAGDDFEAQLNNFDENEELLVTTKDSVYNINCNDYYLENDTVFGTIRTKLDEQSTLKTNVEIPVEEIETVLLALGITVGVFAIIFLISIDMDLKSV